MRFNKLKDSIVFKGRIRSITPILTLLFILFHSCAPDPTLKLLESYSFIFENQQGQRLNPGESINVVLRIYNNKEQVAGSFKVVFDIPEGGGTVSQETYLTDNNAVASTTWMLGSGALNHRLSAAVYKQGGEYLTSTNLTAFTFRENEWDTVTASPDGKINELVADTVYGVTFMIAAGKVYKQGTKYYIWDEVNDPLLESPRTIEIDRNGIIYVSTGNGEIIKSPDHGVSWQKCTKPYPDNPYFIYMYVSNDNYVWVFKFDYPMLFSADGGISWIPAASELSSHGYGEIFRLKNGTLVFHGSDCCSLFISENNGLTWAHIETPGGSNKLYVNEKDEIFICNQENGVSILKSTDMGVTFRKLYSCYPQFSTSMDNIFNKLGNTYYILIPGYGILKSDDLEHYEIFWINNMLDNLFIDHNGVLIAKGWNNNTVYYLKTSR